MPFSYSWSKAIWWRCGREAGLELSSFTRSIKPQEKIQLLASLLQHLFNIRVSSPPFNSSCHLLNKQNTCCISYRQFLEKVSCFFVERGFLFGGSIFAFLVTVNLARRFHSDDFANLDFIKRICFCRQHFELQTACR